MDVHQQDEENLVLTVWFYSGIYSAIFVGK
ncbi:mCG1035212 [Mus musculus]|nr:mCG1035212 [Mus musculus]